MSRLVGPRVTEMDPEQRAFYETIVTGPRGQVGRIFGRFRRTYDWPLRTDASEPRGWYGVAVDRPVDTD